MAYSLKCFFMDNMNDLRDLLRFDVQHLISIEEQIIDALPAMINKAHNPQLKQALEQHLRVTETQRDRLDQVQRQLGQDADYDNGIFAGLFSSGTKNKGMDGLIDDGEKILALDMNPNVKDAAIIGCAQKIEHVEIAAYGTARTFAEQLGLMDVAQLLQQTLLEEHDADDLLTSLAVGDVNERAEAGTTTTSGRKTTYR
jgi:ferritin-like metal-binding protein YciE